MMMPSYQIRLLETRVSADDIDDVASFDVECGEDGRTWRVSAFVSPLFRLLHGGSQASVESRRDMVAGLGAREIAERLRRGLEPADQESLIFATDYPGAPGDPDPLLPYDQVTVHAGDIETEPLSVPE
jgi:hypothetical protein